MAVATRGARIVVGLDFGTTFSGFAYAHTSDPSKIYDLNRWPQAREAYVKTQTSLYYVPTENGGYELRDWGWPAFNSYSRDLEHSARKLRNKGQKDPTNVVSAASGPRDEVGCYMIRFKLQLADSPARAALPASGPSPPACLNVQRLITDYLRCISTFILQQLQQKYGQQLTMEEVQWCLTVPAIWSDSAKQKMKIFAQKAGMVAGSYTPEGVKGSRHELIIVLEPEAASFYCHQKAKLQQQLREGDQFLVVDVGGGTVDIVVHAIASSGSKLKVREVRASSGDMCGGSFVDANFNKFLCQKIGCFREFSAENRWIALDLQRKFQQYKSSFDGEGEIIYEFPIQRPLAEVWEKYDLEKNGKARGEGYGELDLCTHEMKSIFDPQVDKILQLVEDSMTKDVKVLMVVGGFSASPYLMKRIHQRFKGKVQQIINPPEPGSAICHGAVLMGLTETSEIISRVSRKTYGILARTIDQFTEFFVFVRAGDEVDVDRRVSHVFYPSVDKQRLMEVSLYTSSIMPPPKDISDGDVELEGSFILDISEDMELDRNRQIDVTMYFGKSAILVQARRRNFGDTTTLQELPFKIIDGVL